MLAAGEGIETMLSAGGLPAFANFAVQEVGSYLGHSGRGANVFGKATVDPKPMTEAISVGDLCLLRVHDHAAPFELSFAHCRTSSASASQPASAIR